MKQQTIQETITIKKIYELGSSPMAPDFELVNRIGEIQMYKAQSMFSTDGPQYGFMIDNQHVRLPENNIGFIIPFESDYNCYECGGEIMIELFASFEGELEDGDWKSWCYNPKFAKESKNMQFPYVPEYEQQTEMLRPGPKELINGGDYDGYAINAYAKHKGWNT